MQSRDSLVPKARRFVKVLDGQQHPIRGLWMRGSRYDARLSSEDTSGEMRTRWVPLMGRRPRPKPGTSSAVSR